MKKDKTQKRQEDALWDLWNSPVGEEDILVEEELRALHKKMGIRENVHHRPVYQLVASVSVAAVLAVVCGVLSVKLYHGAHLRDELLASQFTVSAGVDGPSSVTLPDGTNVLLNARSTISYSPDFGISAREVSLTGQGYFDVTKDASKKFVVSTGNMSITVHGTKFNVYAYPERSIDEVSLVEGSVSVLSGRNELHMKPGEKVVYDKLSGNTSLTKTDNTRETAWMSPDITFTHAPLSEVFDVLQRRFGVTIIADENMDFKDRYTGNFTGRRLPEILSILKMHYHFQYKTTDNTITLTSNEK